MSVRIKNLEKELGVRLFDRLGKSISLTNQGEIFYIHAVRVLNEVQEAMDSVRPERELSGILHVGTIDSLCSALFPEILREFHKRFPAVELNVATDTPSALLEQLKNNDLDVVYLLDEKITDPIFEKIMEIQEDAVFAGAYDFPLPKGQELEIRELLACPLILTEKDASYRRVLEEQLKELQLQMKPVFESNNTDLLLRMAVDRMGITFVPEYALARSVDKGILRRLEAKDIHVTVYRQVLHHKNKWVTREMKAFFDLLREWE